MSVKIDLPAGLYMRIETAAGGLYASDLAFARAAWSKLNKGGRSPEQREFRRAFLTAVYDMRSKARDTVYRHRL